MTSPLENLILEHVRLGGKTGAREVWRSVGTWYSLNSIRTILARLRKRGLLDDGRPVVRGGPIQLSGEAWALLEAQARARGVRPGDLAEALLWLSLSDGMCDAVLDGVMPVLDQMAAA